jgi:HSP20 family protein
MFSEFDRLQDTVNALMGDFGRRRAGVGRGIGGFGLDPFSSMGGGVDDLFGWDMGVPTLGASQWGTQPLLTSGGKFDETKMDESATGAGTAMQPSTRGGQIVPSTGLGQLPVLRCRVNVEDQKDQLIVTAEVPGFDKENLKVNISDDNVLTICGEQKKEHIEQSKDKKFLRTERAFGSVQRSLRLPRHVDKTGVTASYENGILHINVPKKEEQKEKTQVNIK